MPYPIAAPGKKPKVPATLIVAASDSKDISKADYVCDGTDDQEEINQAISDLPSSGGRVVLLEGTYNLGSEITISKDNVLLEGQGFGTILKSNHIFIENKNNIIIRNLTLQGGTKGIRINLTSSDQSKNILIENLYLKNHTHAIDALKVENLVVDNCIAEPGNTFVNCSVSKKIILSNSIQTSGECGLYVSGSASTFSEYVYCCSNYLPTCVFHSNTRYVVVSDNCIYDYFSIASGDYSIDCNTSNNIIFTSNTIAYGIHLESTHSTSISSNIIGGTVYCSSSDNNRIIGNLFTGNDSKIDLSSGGNNIVIGNRIPNNTGTCISIGGNQNVVIGNLLRGSIDSTGSGNIVAYNIINSNTVDLGTKALNKGNASSVTVTETSETLKQSVSPDLNFMYYVEGIHVIANNPSGSGVTLYFKVKAELDNGSEVELASKSVSEGDSFDSWLRWIYDSVTNMYIIKSIKLYAYCSATPASGYEPTVQLERVTGLQG